MMRKIVLGLAAAGAALIAAAPASAQYYPQPYGYGYGYGNFGQVRALQMRIDNVERHIRLLDRRNVVRDDRADRLRFEANQIERKLRWAARNGLNPYEANDINARIVRLEQRVQFAMNDRRYGWNGYNGGYYGDRYEREHERWHERHDDDDRND